jgi:hypothetical protein
MNIYENIIKSNEKAITYGIGAGLFQVSTFLWLRTTTNYQYRYGYDIKTALKKLYNQGGII